MAAAAKEPVAQPVAQPVVHSDLTELWKRASEEYNEKVGADWKNYQLKGPYHGIKDVQTQVENFRTTFDDARFSGASRQLGAWMMRYLGFISTVCEQVGPAVSTAFPPAGSIFTALVFFFKVCSTITMDLDALMEMLDQIGGTLGLLKILEHDTPLKSNEIRPKPFLQQITKVMTTFIFVIGVSMKYMKPGNKHGFKFFKHIFKGSDSDIQDAQKRIARNYQDLSLVTGFVTLRILELLKMGMDNVNNKIENVEGKVDILDIHLSDLRDHIDLIFSRTTYQVGSVRVDAKSDSNLEAMPLEERKNNNKTKVFQFFLQPKTKSVLDSIFTAYDSLKEKHNSDTPIHLFQNNAFKAWWEDENYPYLWIYGPTGSGKAHLAYGIAERLAENQNVFIAFCIVKDTKGDRITLTDILTTVLIHLAKRDDSFSDYLAQQSQLSKFEDGPIDSNKLWRCLSAYYRKGSKRRAVIVLSLPRMTEQSDNVSLGNILNNFDKDCRISFVLIANDSSKHTQGFTKLATNEVSTSDDDIMDDDRAKVIRTSCNDSIDLRFSEEFQDEMIGLIGKRTMREISDVLESIRGKDETEAKEKLQELANSDDSGGWKQFKEKIEKLQGAFNESDREMIRKIILWVAYMRFRCPTPQEFEVILKSTQWKEPVLRREIDSGRLSDIFEIADDGEVSFKDLSFYEFAQSEEQEPNLTGITTEDAHLAIFESCVNLLTATADESDNLSVNFDVQPMDGLLTYAAKSFTWHMLQLANAKLNNAMLHRFVTALYDAMNGANRVIENLVTCAGTSYPYMAIWMELEEDEPVKPPKIDESPKKMIEAALYQEQQPSPELETSPEESHRRMSSRLRNFLSKPVRSISRHRRTQSEGFKATVRSLNDELSRDPPATTPEPVSKPDSRDIAMEIPDDQSEHTVEMTYSSAWIRKVERWARELERYQDGQLSHASILQLRDFWHVLLKWHTLVFLRSNSKEAAQSRYKTLRECLHVERKSRGLDDSPPLLKIVAYLRQEYADAFRTIAKDDGPAQTQYAISQILLDDGYYQDASKECASGLEIVKSAQLKFKLLATQASALLSMDSQTEARTTANQAIEIFSEEDDTAFQESMKPFYEEAWVVKGEASFRQSQLDEAIHAFQIARRQTAEDHSQLVKSMILALYERNKPGDHVEVLKILKDMNDDELERVLQGADSSLTGNRINTAVQRIGFRMHRTETVAKLYRRLIDAKNSSEFYYRLGVFRRAVQRDENAALEVFEKGLEDVDLYYSSGRYQYQKLRNNVLELLRERFRETHDRSTKEAVYQRAKKTLENDRTSGMYGGSLGPLYEARLRVLVAQMAKRVGQKSEWQDLLTQAFEECMNALSDSTAENDQLALAVLARVLYELPKSMGLKRDSELAQSMFFSSVGSVDEEDFSVVSPRSQDQQQRVRRVNPDDDWLADRTISCDGECQDSAIYGWPVEGEGGKRGFYSCTVCVDTVLCLECYAKRQEYNSSVESSHWREFCGRNHTYIAGPIEGWKGVKNGVIQWGGERVSFKRWKRDLRQRFEEAWEKYWSD